MFDFGRQQVEHPSDEEHDRSSFSESPLLFGKSSRSCRLEVNEKYSDTPPPPTDNDKIGLKKLLSLPKSASSKQNHSEPAAEQQGNIELTASGRKDDTSDETDGVTSPPLWQYPRSSSSISNSTEVLASKSRGNYNRFFSFNDTIGTTTTDFVSNRSQEIARGRQELMDMIRTMPENSYELSLKDLIEHKQQPQPTKDDHHDATPETEPSRNSSNNSNNHSSSTTSKVSSKDQTKSNRENNIPVLKRSKSADSSNGKNGPVLLKMFLPFSDFGMHKKKRKNKGSKKSAYYAKVSPKPTPLIEGEKNSATTTNTSIDKEWWKKRFAVAADKDQTEITISHVGLDSRGESSGTSNSSNGSRKMAGLLTCFWSSNTKKTKTISLKGSDY